MNNEKKSIDSSRKLVSLKNLYLDPNNFRLINESRYVKEEESRVKDKTVMGRTFRLLAGDKNQNIQDLIDSFKSNGYLPVDQIQVKELSGGGYLVVEGNRRIAALKYLSREYEERDSDIGVLKAEFFSKIPVVMYVEGDELHYLTLMALKHISGNKKWAEWNQAKLLEKMHSTYNFGEEEICRKVGISKVELRRSLRALSFLQQYRESDYGDQFEDSKFAIFMEVIRNAELKKWLGWDDTKYKATEEEHRELFFAWLSREPVEEEDEEGRIGYGQKYLEPALLKRDDIRTLGKLIYDEKAMDILKETRDINEAYRSSDHIFKERQTAAIKSLNGDIDTLNQMAIDGKNLPEIESALGRLQSIAERTRASGLAGVEQKTVFHDRIDRHFSSLFIENYKLIQGLEIDKISRINLFAGINNSGKTSLLEAVYLLCRQNDFHGLMEIVRRRGKIPEDRLNPEWFLEQLPRETIVKGCFDDTESAVSIRHYREENGEIDKSMYLKTVEISAEFGANKQESITRVFKGRDRETHAGTIKILCPSVFSSPFFLNEPHRYTNFYHKSIQSKALPEILKFIRERVVDSLTDIRLVDERQRFLVTDTNYEYALDLTEYGEGVQRIFFISLLFASARNGVILIDEFENAIHTELIANFARFIHDLSKLFNVQVFLTSHSKECIDAFVKNIPSVDELSACALVAHDGKISARQFSGPEFARLVEAGNVDLRRAK